MTDLQTGTVTTTDVTTSLGSPHTVVLHNDEEHSMEEVIVQIIKAIACSLQKAESIMTEAHSKGRAVVISSHLERCEHVAAVLEQIGLRVDIE